MTALTFSEWAFLYLLSGVGSIFALWLYYDLRDRRLHVAARRTTVFHCVKCANIYSATGGVSSAQCPRCGFHNSKLKF